MGLITLCMKSSILSIIFRYRIIFVSDKNTYKLKPEVLHHTRVRSQSDIHFNSYYKLIAAFHLRIKIDLGILIRHLHIEIPLDLSLPTFGIFCTIIICFTKL